MHGHAAIRAGLVQVFKWLRHSEFTITRLAKQSAKQTDSNDNPSFCLEVDTKHRYQGGVKAHYQQVFWVSLNNAGLIQQIDSYNNFSLSQLLSTTTKLNPISWLRKIKHR